MFNLFKKKEDPKPVITPRDMLFGDVPLEVWAKDENAASGEPWVTFIEARKQLASGDKKSAIANLQKITEMPGLEPRHYLQAWNALRPLGVNPPAEKAKITYGVVVEVGMPQGCDFLAAYTDFTAQYINYTGASTIWLRPNNSLDAEIEAVLKAGQTIASQIGPWEQPRLPAPPNGNIRLNMLTPSGLHFGAGGFNELSRDPMGASLINPATALMQKITQMKS